MRDADLGPPRRQPDRGRGDPLPALLPRPCGVLAGTRIAIPDGEAPIGALRPGDHVATAGGDVRRIVWVGTRGVAAPLLPEAGRTAFLPVRITADAFGPGLPRRDLLVARSQAICLHGALIPAELLLTATLIAPCTRLAALRYVHLELDVPDMILAEGVAIESWQDRGDRNAFGNVLAWCEAGAPRGAAAPPALPAVTEGPLLERIRDELAARAVAHLDGAGPGRGEIIRLAALAGFHMPCAH